MVGGSVLSYSRSLNCIGDRGFRQSGRRGSGEGVFDTTGVLIQRGDATLAPLLYNQGVYPTPTVTVRTVTVTTIHITSSTTDHPGQTIYGGCSVASDQ